MDSSEQEVPAGNDQETPLPAIDSLITPSSGFTHYRTFASHPTYRKMAPWLSFLRRFAPVIGTLTLIVATGSGVISLVNLLQSHDLYLRSLQPVIVVTLDAPTKQKPRQFVISNPSGADAHEVRMGCTRLPAWTSIYADIPIRKQDAAIEVARNSPGLQAPIDSNCPAFSPGPEPPGTPNPDMVLLPFFLCYLDEREQPHSLVRLFAYTSKEPGFKILPMASNFGRQLMDAAKQQCRAIPQSS